MPLRIQNKEMARVKALADSWQREPDLGETFGEFVDTPAYTTYILPVFYKERKFEADYPDKPLFYNRIPGGRDFNQGPSGSESPCRLNLIDILDVKRHWEVMEEQRCKRRLMGKKFSVQSAGRDALRPKETLQSEVPLTFLPDATLDQCKTATHHHFPFTCFPMGVNKNERAVIMAQAKADTEVEQITSGNARGCGDLRNSDNINFIPTRLLSKRAKSPAKLSRLESSQSMLSAGTMMSERTYSSPGLPEEGFDKAGFITQPMGLPFITFAKKEKKKKPKVKECLLRRGSLSTTRSKGWKERDLSQDLTAGSPGMSRSVSSIN